MDVVSCSQKRTPQTTLGVFSFLMSLRSFNLWSLVHTFTSFHAGLGLSTYYLTKQGWALIRKKKFADETLPFLQYRSLTMGSGSKSLVTHRRLYSCQNSMNLSPSKICTYRSGDVIETWRTKDWLHMIIKDQKTGLSLGVFLPQQRWSATSSGKRKQNNFKNFQNIRGRQSSCARNAQNTGRSNWMQ
jgi:hypothetical protein